MLLKYSDLLAKNRKFFYPLSFSTLVRVNPFEFLKKFYGF